MAYLDKNGLNYYSQKVSGKIQDVQDDLDELKIIEEEESEVVDVQWNTGTGVWTHFNNQFEFLWGDGSTNPISVNSGEKYFISTYTDASDTPAVILVNNSERYSHGIIEDQYIIATYGNSSLYEGIITIPQNVAQMIVNNTNDHYTPIIKKITKECVKVEKLADANFVQKNYVDGQISSLQTELATKADTSSLATVAISGSYNDLSNKPTIPTNVSDLTNDSNFTTKSYVDGEISSLQTAIPTNLINGSANGSLHSVNTTAENANYTMGTDALAIGKNTKAMGSYSVAEGFATQTDSAASGAHAEGLYTHAEKAGAHSEGIRTYATGIYSHAEGTETKAWADSSHSEGKQTNARGPYSHSEGLGTTALNRSQHVFGEYNNLDDGEASVTSDRGRYIEIVGNGTDAQSLSNARTLDWSGNEVLAGKLTVGTNPVNNMDVTTKQYVDGEIDNLQTTIINVNGTTPTITAEANTMYVCGEVTSLSFTPCASGICDVRFTSGSTVTVLTIPSTVKFPNSFDPTSLETNKIYEINILDGVYGVVTSWAI